MAIKVSLGKLKTLLPLADFVDEQMWRNSISPLTIRTAHAGQVATLPFHHRDPFDRLIKSHTSISKANYVNSINRSSM
jgi:PIN domain nuclease of toxin-antitoxin system